MRIGIFARTFRRPTLAGVLDAIAGHGIESAQFNFSCLGLPTLPDQIDSKVADAVRREFEARGLQMAAVSGTFNMIHPDTAVRRDGLRRLGVLSEACSRAGAPVITLCTGTGDPVDMWREHEDNALPEAWSDLLAGMAEALELAEKHNVTLGIEPEPANVVSSARQARRLLDVYKTPRLKVVMDAANLFHPGDLPRTKYILDEAFDLLGGEIVIAHAKDLVDEGGLRYLAAGKGALDYDYYLERLRAAKFDGPLILHGLEEDEVAGCLAFLRGKIDAAEAKRP